jgi:hypothetical protein
MIALVIAYFIFSNPDATFRSSDGGWADSEIQFHGRKFEYIVWNFEGYKLKCHAPNARLLRATPVRWSNIFAWPSYLQDPKWRVPYSDSHSEIGDYYPPVTMSNCYNVPWSVGITKATDANAANYLKQLE